MCVRGRPRAAVYVFTFVLPPMQGAFDFCRGAVRVKKLIGVISFLIFLIAWFFLARNYEERVKMGHKGDGESGHG